MHYFEYIQLSYILRGIAQHFLCMKKKNVQNESEHKTRKFKHIFPTTSDFLQSESRQIRDMTIVGQDFVSKGAGSLIMYP